MICRKIYIILFCILPVKISSNTVSMSTAWIHHYSHSFDIILHLCKIGGGWRKSTWELPIHFLQLPVCVLISE